MESQASAQPSLVRSSGSSTPASVAFERHYCVSEVAELWGLSERTIRRIFGNEPGVFKWESTETRFKRGYTTLRIPESVVQRVHRKLRKAEREAVKEQGPGGDRQGKGGTGEAG